MMGRTQRIKLEALLDDIQPKPRARACACGAYPDGCLFWQTLANPSLLGPGFPPLNLSCACTQARRRPEGTLAAR